MFNGKCSCHICFIFVLGVAYIRGSCVDNKSIYEELITFCISEWLAAFGFVISFYFVVLFDEVVETITQMRCKVQRRTSCSVGSEHNVVLVIQFFLYEPSTVFLLQFFTVVNKQCGVG